MLFGSFGALFILISRNFSACMHALRLVVREALYNVIYNIASGIIVYTITTNYHAGS